MKRYCVVYRTGGTDNFQWHRSASFTKAEAEAAYDAVKRFGRKCHIADYDLSMAIGLPDTFGNMKIIRSKSGDLHTTCSYQHSLATDCNECCNGEMEAAYKEFKAAEQASLGMDSEHEHAYNDHQQVTADYRSGKVSADVFLASAERLRVARENWEKAFQSQHPNC